MRLSSFQACKFEVYYVEIEAKFDSCVKFGITNTSYDLHAKYCIYEYSVLTSFLLTEMKVEPEQAKEEMDEWLKKTIH